jgi:hypothetical protein
VIKLLRENGHTPLRYGMRSKAPAEVIKLLIETGQEREQSEQKEQRRKESYTWQAAVGCGQVQRPASSWFREVQPFRVWTQFTGKKVATREEWLTAPSWVGG